MAEADGSVVIEITADADRAEKKLDEIKKEVKEIGEESSKKREINFSLNISEAEKELKRLEREIDRTRENIESRQADLAPLLQQREDIKRQRADAIMRGQDELAKSLTKDWDSVNAKIQKHNEYIDKSTQKLDGLYGKYNNLSSSVNEKLQSIRDNAEISDQSIVDLQQELSKLEERQYELKRAGLGLGHEEYNQIEKRISEINNALKEYRDNIASANDKLRSADGFLDKFTKRIVGLAKRVFVFTLITKALRKMRDWLGKAVKTNSEAAAAMARLKGALLTLAQPLVEVVIPAFTLLANVLTALIGKMATLLSTLSGKTAKQSAEAAKNLYREQKALESVGSAAEDAAGSLAGFDEINTIQTEGAAGGGGAGAAAEEIVPDFGWMDGISNRLKEIADLILLIGAGLAMWKIGQMLPGVLGDIATVLGGILMTVGGLLLFWDGLTDAWENGVDWMNLIEMIGGLAAAAFGLYAVFSVLAPALAPIVTGIVLVVGGIAMLVTAFHDAMKNGWTLQNTLLAIAGIVSTGLGFALITGSIIPAVIAAIAALLLAFTVATGHGEELLDGIREMLEGFKEFFSGIFTGDIEKAIGGISKIFDGLGVAVFAVIDGLRDTILSFLDWLDEKTGGKLHGIIEFMKGLFTELFDSIKTTFLGILDAVKQILSGLVQFISGVFTGDWEKAWNGVKNIFKGIWNGIVSVLEGAVNLIIDGINWMIRQLNKVSFNVPDWVPAIGGKAFGFNIPNVSRISIPRLAQGAVIPPNREFMAVLGDQKSGYNIEAPEDLIRKIVREEAGGSGEMLALLQQILAATKAGHVIKVGEREFGRAVVNAADSITTSTGKFAFKF